MVPTPFCMRRKRFVRRMARERGDAAGRGDARRPAASANGRAGRTGPEGAGSKTAARPGSRARYLVHTVCQIHRELPTNHVSFFFLVELQIAASSLGVRTPHSHPVLVLSFLLPCVKTSSVTRMTAGALMVYLGGI
jgi:hypothetical protein